MRTLIYVPVIHTSADLGSLAKDVNKRDKFIAKRIDETLKDGEAKRLL